MKLYLEIHRGQENCFDVCVRLQKFIEKFEIPSAPVCPIVYDSSLIMLLIIFGPKNIIPAFSAKASETPMVFQLNSEKDSFSSISSRNGHPVNWLNFVLSHSVWDCICSISERHLYVGWLGMPRVDWGSLVIQLDFSSLPEDGSFECR